MGRRIFLAGFLLIWSGCGGSSSSGPVAPDITENPPSGDISFPDVCECTKDTDCVGKVETGECKVAVCKGCRCVSENKPVGTPCNDGSPSTIEDKCNDKGVCVGTPVTCGNGKCEPTENCGNCLQDCGCGEGEYCDGDHCVKAVCGNGKCETALENCENCVLDCGCKAEDVCYEKKCLTCQEYCQQTGKECGKPEGTPCDCGECQPGYACDGFYHCYQATICGNHVCEPGEDCKSCAADCGCEKGKVCVEGECKDCGPICEAAGKECGFYEGCDCGSCKVCYNCYNNQCVPKCDCVCWNKECGEVDGCKCGPNQGQCPQGKECVGYKCVEGCDTLCQGVECGWVKDCICGFCEGCDACHQHQCGPGADIDEFEVYPYNDTPETATDLGATTDDDVASSHEIEGSIDVGFDLDWFKIEVSDTFGYTLDPTFELKGLAEDKDLDLVVCYKCKSGATVGLAAEPKDSVVEVDSPIQGAKCFASINLWGQDEVLYLKSLTCQGGGFDGSGTAYILVMPVTDDDCGSAYHLSFHF